MELEAGKFVDAPYLHDDWWAQLSTYKLFLAKRGCLVLCVKLLSKYLGKLIQSYPASQVTVAQNLSLYCFVTYISDQPWPIIDDVGGAAVWPAA